MGWLVWRWEWLGQLRWSASDKGFALDFGFGISFNSDIFLNFFTVDMFALPLLFKALDSALLNLFVA